MNSRERDRQTKQFFNDQVTVRIRDRERVRRRSEQLFGRALSEQEWAVLIGAPDGATVDVTAGLSGAEIRLDARHPFIREMDRRVVRDPLGRTIIRNERLFLRPEAPAGLGTRILAHQVRSAALLGVAYLEATAIRGPLANGYYTWPLLGFDGSLSDATRRALPDRLRSARSLHDLFGSPGGAEWWRLHGETIDVHFDLSSRSLSSRRLRAYLARYAVRI